MTVFPNDAEFTTVQSADVLQVSRPYLIKLLDQKAILHRRVGKHRRVRVEDVVAYKVAIDREREDVLDQLTREAQDQSLDYECPVTGYTALLDANVLCAGARPVNAICSERGPSGAMDGRHPSRDDDFRSTVADALRRAEPPMLTTIIGRGHSGTRAMSHTLSASGVWMGEPLNGSGDLLPPQATYEASRLIARHVRWLGGLEWDFSRLHTMRIPPGFEPLIRSYLQSVLTSPAEHTGWKIPETTLTFPWIVRMLPDVRYIFWIRNPRDCIVGRHITDNLSDWGVAGPPTHDARLRPAISWKYQYDLVHAGCGSRISSNARMRLSPVWSRTWESPWPGFP